MSDFTTSSSASQTESTNSQPTPKHNSQGMELASKAVRGNWKTTAIGLLLSFTGFVAFSPSTFGGEEALVVQLCRYITSGGLAALGVYSKDFNVTGGNKQE